MLASDRQIEETTSIQEGNVYSLQKSRLAITKIEVDTIFQKKLSRISKTSC